MTPAHRALAVVALAHAVEELASPAVLHYDVHVDLILIHSLQQNIQGVRK
jgi:hypothetical protein